MQAQIQAAKLAKDQLKVLGELGTDLDKKASIPFRVYVDLGEGKARRPTRSSSTKAARTTIRRLVGRRRTPRPIVPGPRRRETIKRAAPRPIPTIWI